MSLKRLAIITVHTSPLAKLGGNKTGGMNVYVREIAQELGRRDIAVDIYTRRTSASDPDIDDTLGANVRVIYISAGAEQPLTPDEVYPYLPQFTAGVLASTARENTQYDLVYSHYWLSGLVAHALQEVWGTPFVQMFHTLGHMKNRIILSRAASLAPDVRIHHETRIVRWANCVIAATAAEQSQLLWLYRADRRKIVIIPPGVNAERFYPVPMEQAKQQIGIPSNYRVLSFVGRIEPLKGVENILQALYLLRQKTPRVLSDVCFTVIGGDLKNPDSELTRLQQLSVQLGLSQYVRFLGAQDHTRLP
ncbi:MAG: glycosyltransferase, partial [Anaerolineae bacterium]|nr:glycosyltransferase [Anaerolineae bacterium]